MTKYRKEMNKKLREFCKNMKMKNKDTGRSGTGKLQNKSYIRHFVSTGKATLGNQTNSPKIHVVYRKRDKKCVLCVCLVNKLVMLAWFTLVLCCRNGEWPFNNLYNIQPNENLNIYVRIF